MSLATITLLALALYVVQLFLQETTRYRFDMRAILGNRDDVPETSRIARRLDRAKNNMLEALPIFLGLALLTLIRDGDMSPARHAALVFLIARVLHVPAYASGLPVLRSIIWLVGTAALFAMALPLV